MTRLIEAMLLLATEPVSATEIAANLEVPQSDVEEALNELAQFYLETERGFQLVQVAGGWRLATAPDLSGELESWVVADQRAKLSQAALETLAVIAYRQPVSRGRISGIRGVNVDGVVKNLLLRGLVVEAGPDPDTGAMTFATTPLFLQKMGLGSTRPIA